VVWPPMWGLVCACTLCTLDNPASIHCNFVLAGLPEIRRPMCRIVLLHYERLLLLCRLLLLLLLLLLLVLIRLSDATAKTLRQRHFTQYWSPSNISTYRESCVDSVNVGSRSVHVQADVGR